MADPAASASPSATSSLVGKRIVVTRAVAQTSELFEKLQQRGAVPTSMPLISFSAPADYAPLDAALRHWHEFDWVLFTSANAVQSVVTRSAAANTRVQQIDRRPRIAAVGPATSEEATRAGLFVEYVAKTHLGVALAEELAPQLRDRSVVLPRSDRAHPDLPAALKRHGAKVTEVIAYRTLPPSEIDAGRAIRVISHEADAALFFSPSAVRNLADLIGKQSLVEIQNKIAFAAVGPVTTAALREQGIDRVVTAADATAEAIINALELHFAGFAATQRQPIAGAEHG